MILYNRDQEDYRMKFMTIFFLLASAAHAENWDGRIFNVKTNTEISPAEYVEDLSHFSIIVLGEKHYTPAVQLAQAQTISKVVHAAGKVGHFTTGWEFLNVTSQSETDRLFSQVTSKQMTAATFLNRTQGDNPSLSYAPIIDATADLGGQLLGMNLSREEKAPVTKNGLEALDPKLLPPGFDHGTAGYYERFVEEMQGHATPTQVKNYYDSQCLVDDVMAYHLLKDSKNGLNFLIVGSFHTDFYDGAVNRIKVRSPGIEIVTVKVIDASDYEEKDLMNEMHSDQYGDIADYVYFVNNPM
jgi:uncharacterized iron-regulated protein